MKDSSIAEINIALVEIFGLFALVGALLIWRAAEAGTVRKQLDWLRDWRELAFHSRWISRSRALVRARQVVWLTFFSCTLMACWETYHYLNVTEGLVGVGSALDFGLFEKLRRHAAEAKQWALQFGFLAGSAALLDTFLTGYLQQRLRPVDACMVPASSHPAVLARSWRMSPAGMWEDRIERSAKQREALMQAVQVAGCTALEPKQWRIHWPTWAACVVAYQVLAEQDVAASGGGDIPFG